LRQKRIKWPRIVNIIDRKNKIIEKRNVVKGFLAFAASRFAAFIFLLWKSGSYILKNCQTRVISVI